VLAHSKPYARNSRHVVASRLAIDDAAEVHDRLTARFSHLHSRDGRAHGARIPRRCGHHLIPAVRTLARFRAQPVGQKAHTWRTLPTSASPTSWPPRPRSTSRITRRSAHST